MSEEKFFPLPAFKFFSTVKKSIFITDNEILLPWLVQTERERIDEINFIDGKIQGPDLIPVELECNTAIIPVLAAFKNNSGDNKKNQKA